MGDEYGGSIWGINMRDQYEGLIWGINMGDQYEGSESVIIT